jgi:hypothetical protein
LEDLLDGIHGSWLLYRECADDLEDFTDDGPVGGEEEDLDDIDTRFFEPGRVEAAESQGRL